MRSVKDSFDSELESIPDAAREAAVPALNKAKKRNSIPEGVSTGFKRASELLRVVEASTTSSDAGIHGPNGSNLEELYIQRHGVDGDIKSKRKAPPVRSTRKKRATKSIEDTVQAPSANTSRYFLKDDQGESYALQINNAHVRQAATYQKAAPENAAGTETVPVVPPIRASTSQTSGQLDTIHENRKPSPDVYPQGEHLSLDVSKPKSITKPTTLSAVEETTAEGSASVKKPRTIAIASTSSAVLDTARPLEGQAVVDLTTESDIKDGPSRMASIVKKYSHQIQDSSAIPRGIASISNTEPIIDRSKDTNPSLAPPTLKRRASPSKSKSPAKKKALTVTEKALIDFRAEEIGDSLPLSQYFPLTLPIQPSDEAESTTRAKSRSKSARRPKTVQKKSSLMTPSDALRSLHDQHLVFGTSSQLMQYSSSPTYETNFQTKEHSSAIPNMARNDSFVDIDSLLGASPGLLVLKSTRSLWSAAHRDDDGSLIGADTAELVETKDTSITVPESIDAVATFPHNSKTNDHEPDPDKTKATISIASDHIVDSAILMPVSATNTTTEQAPIVTKAIPTLARSLGEAATRQRADSKSPVKKKRRVKHTNDKPEDPFKKVPLDDLKAELRSYGCKIPRSRAKMGDLILECRAKQNNLKKSDQDQSVPGQDLLPTHVLLNVLPVIDSVNPLASNTVESSPSKGEQGETMPSGLEDLPPPSFQVPVGGSHNQQDQAQINELLAGIHQAIITQPPSHSIQQPSWKEKIAMYDPIVLEELTAWLNGGGLDAVGVDAEVWPGLVRDWCESKSVCFVEKTGGWRKQRQK